MRKSIILFAVLAASFTITSCGKDDDTTPNNTNNTTNDPPAGGGGGVTEYFKASIDGNAFTATSYDFSIPQGLSDYRISGTDGSKSISIKVSSGTIKAGTYTIEDATQGVQGIAVYGFYQDQTGQVSKSGSLTISKHDVTNKIIEGTFNFNVGDRISGGGQHTISNGSFVIDYN